VATDAESRVTQKKRPKDPPLTLSLAEAARMLGISQWHCGELARAGKLPSLKLGRRRLFPREAIQRLINETAAK